MMILLQTLTEFITYNSNRHEETIKDYCYLLYNSVYYSYDIYIYTLAGILFNNLIFNTMRSAKITYSDGTVINTSLAANLTDKEINEYFKIGRQFNIGNVNDNLQTVVNCEITPLYETGATNHAVNDLILFTDNTRELTELRDNIYQMWLDFGSFGTIPHYERFIKLFNKAKQRYISEFPNFEDHKHISLMDGEQIREYCQLYVLDFENWRNEHK
jgi:hypothetical protein